MTVHHQDPQWWLSCDAVQGCTATTPPAVLLAGALSTPGWTTRMQAIRGRTVGRWHLCFEHKNGEVRNG